MSSNYLNAVLGFVESKYKETTEVEIKLELDVESVAQQHLEYAYEHKKALEIAKLVIQACAEKKYPTSFEDSIRYICTHADNLMTYVEGGANSKDKRPMLGFTKQKVVNSIYGIAHKPDVAIAYKITIANEEPESKDNKEFVMGVFKKSDISRLRSRISFTIDDWRLDITLVKLLDFNVSAHVQELSKQKAAFFGARAETIQDFLASPAWEACDHVDIEVESISHKPPTRESLARGLQILADSTVPHIRSVSSSSSSSSDDSKIGSVTGAGANTPNGNDAFNLQMQLYEIASDLKLQNAYGFQPPNAIFGIKKIHAQAISLDRLNWYQDVREGFMSGKYLVSDKINGERGILRICCNATNKLLLITHELVTIDIDLPAPTADELKGCLGNTMFLVDVEVYEDTINCLEIMIYDGQHTYDESYMRRLELTAKFAKMIQSQASYNAMPFKIVAANAAPSNTLKSARDLMKYMETKHPYQTDGVIIKRNDTSYFTTAYKLKPKEHSTIDFLLKKVPKNVVGLGSYDHPEKDTKTLYLLFVGCRREVFERFGPNLPRFYNTLFPQTGQKYLAVPFVPSSNPNACIWWSDDSMLDGKICEMGWEQGKWILHRVREDRTIDANRGNYFGNDSKVAEQIWGIICQPLTIEEMYAKHEQQFSLPVLGKLTYKLMSSRLQTDKPNNIMCIYPANGSIVKLCHTNNIGLCYALHSDHMYIDMIDRMKYEIKGHSRVENKQAGPGGMHKLTIRSIHSALEIADFEELETAGITNLQKGVEYIFCTNMLENLFTSVGTFNTSIAKLQYLIAKRGHILLMGLDGDKIHQIGGKTIKVGTHTITKEYKGKPTIGSKISIDGAEMPMILFSELKKLLPKKGIKLIEETAVSSILPNIDVYDIPEDQLAVLNYYTICIFISN